MCVFLFNIMASVSHAFSLQLLNLQTISLAKAYYNAENSPDPLNTHTQFLNKSSHMSLGSVQCKKNCSFYLFITHNIKSFFDVYVEQDVSLFAFLYTFMDICACVYMCAQTLLDNIKKGMLLLLLRLLLEIKFQKHL